MIDSETLPQPRSDAPAETELEPSAQAEPDAGPAQGVSQAAPTEVEVKFIADARASGKPRLAAVARQRPPPARAQAQFGLFRHARLGAARIAASPCAFAARPRRASHDAEMDCGRREGVFSRGEIEVRVSKLQPDLSLLDVEMGEVGARDRRRQAARSQIRDPCQPNHPHGDPWRVPDRGRLRRGADRLGIRNRPCAKWSWS